EEAVESHEEAGARARHQEPWAGQHEQENRGAEQHAGELDEKRRMLRHREHAEHGEPERTVDEIAAFTGVEYDAETVAQSIGDGQRDVDRVVELHAGADTEARREGEEQDDGNERENGAHGKPPARTHPGRRETRRSLPERESSLRPDPDGRI